MDGDEWYDGECDTHWEVIEEEYLALGWPTDRQRHQPRRQRRHTRA
jgi:hypothetical protein